MPVRGSYLSPAEILGEDPELLMLAPGLAGVAPRIGEDKIADGEPDDAGDWGINLQYFFNNWDFEAQVFYLNYSSNIPDGLVGTLDFGQAVATFGGITPVIFPMASSARWISARRLPLSALRVFRPSACSIPHLLPPLMCWQAMRLG